MTTFQEFFLEYRKVTDPTIFTSNGKSMYTGASRKHLNTVRKEYKHKDPAVNQIVSGSTPTMIVAGNKLTSLLQQYGITFKAGVVKTLGNSGAQIQLSIGTNGQPQGKLIKKLTESTDMNNTKSGTTFYLHFMNPDAEMYNTDEVIAASLSAATMEVLSYYGEYPSSMVYTANEEVVIEENHDKSRTPYVLISTEKYDNMFAEKVLWNILASGECILADTWVDNEHDRVRRQKAKAEVLHGTNDEAGLGAAIDTL